MAIGLGAHGFTEEATAYLTKFVFYFALSAMIFQFSANLDAREVFSWPFIFAYLWATALVYAIVTFVALWRGLDRGGNSRGGAAWA